MPEQLQARFLSILPRLERHGRVSFRHLRCRHRKEDAVQEMVGLAWKWFQRLAQQGKDPTHFPSALASFAARDVRCGRRLTAQEKGTDVLSPLAQRRHHFAADKLPNFDTLGDDPFSEALVDNTVSPVPEQVAFRLDFAPGCARSASRTGRWPSTWLWATARGSWPATTAPARGGSASSAATSDSTGPASAPTARAPIPMRFDLTSSDSANEFTVEFAFTATCRRQLSVASLFS
jgi:hypothetical protein